MAKASLKNISLNISERLAALSILNDFKGNLDKLSVILEDIKQFPPEQKEWDLAERKISAPDVEGNVTWNWDDEKGGLKSIDIQEGTVEALRTAIKEKDEKGEFTPKDKAFITLKTKLI